MIAITIVLALVLVSLALHFSIARRRARNTALVFEQRLKRYL
jgi:hypothetical protein